MWHRHWIAGWTLAVVTVASAHAATPATPACAVDWPLWRDFVSRFVSEDGRVVDTSVSQHHSTSESQSYGMFFALVANDRPLFDRLWQWSVDNLTAGDATQQLPAWRWGRTEDGEWGVLDANTAADGDLWFAYALLEAARLWNDASYQEAALQLMARIAEQETAHLPGLGRMLLPGANGFVLDEGVWRLNPSYLMLPQLRRLAAADPDGPWEDIAHSGVRMLEAITPHGLVPDWIEYAAAGSDEDGFRTDAVQGDKGSYDAIRVYLWAAVTAAEDPLAAAQLAATRGMLGLLDAQGNVPEVVSATIPAGSGSAPVGFAAALLPYLRTHGQTELLPAYAERVATGLGSAAQPPLYYDYVLALFGLGWTDGRYRFLVDGGVRTSWEMRCPYANTP